MTERDCREWKLLAINPYDRHTCPLRCGARSAMLAESQLSARGPTDVDVAPVPARQPFKRQTQLQHKLILLLFFQRIKS